MSVYPRVVFTAQQGWEVIQLDEHKFRLLDWYFGRIATFRDLRSAVNYMEQEFL